MRGLRVTCLTADARRLARIGSFALVIAPMQFLQIIGGAAGRAELLAGVAACLRPGGTFAAAIADLDEAIAAEDAPPQVPDVGQRGDWIYSSLPLDVRPEPGGVAVEWLRQTVSPGRRPDRAAPHPAARLAHTGRARARGGRAWPAPVERRVVPETAAYIGSMVVVCRR